MFSQSVHRYVDTAQLCAVSDIAGQHSYLPLWGCYGNTNECRMAKHAEDTACNTVSVVREHWNSLWTIWYSRNTMTKGRPGVWDNILRNLNQQMLMSLMASWRQATPFAMLTLCNIALLYFRIRQYQAWWCLRYRLRNLIWNDDAPPTNWPWGFLHYAWLTACSTCLHGSNCFVINLLNGSFSKPFLAISLVSDSLNNAVLRCLVGCLRPGGSAGPIKLLGVEFGVLS